MTQIKSKPIGAVVKYNGVRLMIIRAIDRCRGCYFHRHLACVQYSDNLGACTARWRNDNTNIIFRKYDSAKKENRHMKKLVQTSQY